MRRFSPAIPPRRRQPRRGVADYTPRDIESAPLAQRLWDDGTHYELHFGSIVGPWWRIGWLAFGLAPVLLGITGLTFWLTKRRSARNRRDRRRAAAAA